MERLTARYEREPTEDEREKVDHVVELARAWEAGELPLESVRIQSTGYDRNVAVRTTGVGTPEKLLINRLLDALVADQNLYETKQGAFEEQDLREDQARKLRDALGRRVIQFPVNGFYRDIPQHKLDEGR
jgi:hypothetical protein